MPQDNKKSEDYSGLPCEAGTSKDNETKVAQVLWNPLTVHVFHIPEKPEWLEDDSCWAVGLWFLNILWYQEDKAFRLSFDPVRLLILDVVFWHN